MKAQTDFFHLLRIKRYFYKTKLAKVITPHRPLIYLLIIEIYASFTKTMILGSKVHDFISIGVGLNFKLKGQ
jgi:hypothetical protein